MELVPGFMELLLGLSATMTAPTFASLTTVLTGCVAAGVLLWDPKKERSAIKICRKPIGASIARIWAM